MVTADDQRRLARLNKYPALQVKPDEYLLVLLENARNHFLNFTHRSEDPGEPVTMAEAPVWWTARAATAFPYFSR